nr:UBN2 domain-containing protein [Tanacetum cinerariifolium]
SALQVLRRLAIIFNHTSRFNIIITSLKSLNEGFFTKNYVKKFLRALHPKWIAKFMAIEESKNLSSLALDKLIGNLKVHEVFMEKDYEIYKGKKERFKSIALKAKKDSSDDETSTSGGDDEEYAMAVSLPRTMLRSFLGAKKDSSDDETSTSGGDDEEYAMAVRNFIKFFRRKGKFVRQPREEKKSFWQKDEKKGKK